MVKLLKGENIAQQWRTLQYCCDSAPVCQFLGVLPPEEKKIHEAVKNKEEKGFNQLNLSNNK